MSRNFHRMIPHLYFALFDTRMKLITSSKAFLMFSFSLHMNVPQSAREHESSESTAKEFVAQKNGNQPRDFCCLVSISESSPYQSVIDIRSTHRNDGAVCNCAQTVGLDTNCDVVCKFITVLNDGMTEKLVFFANLTITAEDAGFSSLMSIFESGSFFVLSIK